MEDTNKKKIRALWKMSFSIFYVVWVLRSSVRIDLEGCKGSFVGKKRRQVLRAGPLCFFWIIWKNRIAFEDDLLSIKELKSSFVCFRWLETIVYEGLSFNTIEFINSLISH